MFTMPLNVNVLGFRAGKHVLIQYFNHIFYSISSDAVWYSKHWVEHWIRMSEMMGIPFINKNEYAQNLFDIIKFYNWSINKLSMVYNSHNLHNWNSYTYIYSHRAFISVFIFYE